MKSKLSVAVIGVLCIFPLSGGRPAAAATVTIDFSTLAAGTAVTNQYPGVIFSLMGEPDHSGPPKVNIEGYLVNSTNVTATGLFPTANILDISFASPVYFVSFIFYNGGDNLAIYNVGSTFTAYNGGNTVASGPLDTTEGPPAVFISPGIDDLQINNNCPPKFLRVLRKQ